MLFSRQFNSNNYVKQFILWIVLFICVILIAGPLALHVSSALPTVKTRNIPLHLFSEERARTYFSNLTLYGSRVSNTRGDFYARSFLISQIERISSISKRHLQIEFDLQNFTDRQHNQLQNIVVRLSNPATKSKNVSCLLLTAHYDSVEFSLGGSDDGSGIVILLELLSNLVNDLTLTFSNVHLIVLFTSAEEINSQGAKEFISNHIWRSDIRYFINIDATTCNEKASLNRIIPSQLVVDYSRVSRPRANVIIEYIHKWLRLMSDYDVFTLNNSLLGYEFGFLLDGYNYHTSLDHPLMIKQGVLQDLGENLEFSLRWKQLHCTLFEQAYHWLFLPLIVSFIPLTHTIEIVNRLVRILIPLMVRRFSFGWSRLGNVIICSVIAVPTTVFVLGFIPILQRTKHFGRILIILLITFFIVFIIAYYRQPFSSSHPHIFYAKHMSKSMYKIETLSSDPVIVSLISQSSSITVTTYDGLALSPVLSDFSAKSGHILHNQRCLKTTKCTFDDTFNRTIAVQHIEIESMNNFSDYIIFVQHVLSYNIQVSSFPFIKFLVLNQSNIPRTETRIYVTLDSSSSLFDINIKIRRCDLIDSPFLVLFTDIMSNMVLMGKGQCQAIDDDTTLTFNK
ncbi:unnamed protein product [Rotaria sp. Silwood1]|nr:unnamed protein product [Rotaria sp. Silwood1]